MDYRRHQNEILRNRQVWRNKPVLRKIYRTFHRVMARHLSQAPHGLTVELGSGIGNINDILPNCIKTDMFDNPWIDQVENAYALTFQSESVANLLLMDVFHHLQFPGNALDEFYRVLLPGGRLIILEPSISLLGMLIYGGLHPEPLGLMKEITWYTPSVDHLSGQSYYAAQGNAARVFARPRFRNRLKHWHPVTIERFAAIAYILSGGYSRPQLFPESVLPFLERIENLLSKAPFLFATRHLIVLEKRRGLLNKYGRTEVSD